MHKRSKSKRKKRKAMRSFFMEVLRLLRENDFYDHAMKERVLLRNVESFFEGEVLYSRYSKYENPLYVKILDYLYGRNGWKSKAVSRVV